MSRQIGYARVSTTDQDLTVQKAELERVGCSASCCYMKLRCGMRACSVSRASTRLA